MYKPDSRATAAAIFAENPDSVSRARELQCDFSPIPEELAAMRIPRLTLSFTYTRDILERLLDGVELCKTTGMFKRIPHARFFVEGEKGERILNNEAEVFRSAHINLLAVGQGYYSIKKSVTPGEFVLEIGRGVNIADDRHLGELGQIGQHMGLSASVNRQHTPGVNTRPDVEFRAIFKFESPSIVALNFIFSFDHANPVTPREAASIIELAGERMKQIQGNKKQ